MKKILIAVVAVLALAGCASKPMTPEERAYWQEGCKTPLSPAGHCLDRDRIPGLTVYHIRKSPGEVPEHDMKPIWSRD